jgi:hypothetical protein
MTMTTQQRAAATAAQLIQNGNQIVGSLTRAKGIIANGLPASPDGSMPAVTPSDIATALGTTPLSQLDALIAALPAD